MFSFSQRLLYSIPTAAEDSSRSPLLAFINKLPAICNASSEIRRHRFSTFLWVKPLVVKIRVIGFQSFSIPFVVAVYAMLFEIQVLFLFHISTQRLP